MQYTQQTLMVQGTASDAGKSMLVAGLCRCFMQQGKHVAPFKPQNMALNSAVTADGGEIGRAQAVQALAAGVLPHVDMNPVLLKPDSDTGAQVIIHGKVVADMQAQSYHDYKTTAMQAVLTSHQRLCQQYEVIVVEGAGSPAEINLRDKDIANMGFAEAVDCPVILIADIDKGGVFAQLVGTLDLLSPSEQNRIVGFVINKFRGDIKLLESGLDWLVQRTGKPVLGVLPFLHNLQVAAEDAIDTIQNSTDNDTVNVAVPVFRRISNHTDFDILRTLPEVNLHFVPPHAEIPPCDLIILPGSKNVRSDLDMLREMSWDKAIAKHLRYGGKVLGICGGYQMLGESIGDPHGVEGQPGSSIGLGYLPATTTLEKSKQLTQDSGLLYLDHKADPVPVSGYQIHAGQTKSTELSQPHRPFAILNNDLPDGAISKDNQIAGTYLHGVFDTPEALSAILKWAGKEVGISESYRTVQDREIQRVADACEQHLDWQKIHKVLMGEAQ